MTYLSEAWREGTEKHRNGMTMSFSDLNAVAIHLPLPCKWTFTVPRIDHLVEDTCRYIFFALTEIFSCRVPATKTMTQSIGVCGLTLEYCMTDRWLMVTGVNCLYHSLSLFGDSRSFIAYLSILVAERPSERRRVERIRSTRYNVMPHRYTMRCLCVSASDILVPLSPFNAGYRRRERQFSHATSFNNLIREQKL